MIGKVIDKICRSPFLLNLARRVLEVNFNGEKRVISREVKSLSGKLVLDLACGTGEFFHSFDSGNYCGMDISSDYIEFAKQHHRGEFLIGDAQHLSFKDEAFDFVFVLGLFHHLPDNDAHLVLDEIRRVIKPTGLILVMEDIPTLSSLNIVGRLVHRYDKGKYIRGLEEYSHLFVKHLRLDKRYTMRSGVCDYGVFILGQASLFEHSAE